MSHNLWPNQAEIPEDIDYYASTQVNNRDRAPLSARRSDGNNLLLQMVSPRRQQQHELQQNQAIQNYQQQVHNLEDSLDKLHLDKDCLAMEVDDLKQELANRLDELQTVQKQLFDMSIQKMDLETENKRLQMKVKEMERQLHDAKVSVTLETVTDSRKTTTQVPPLWETPKKVQTNQASLQTIQANMIPLNTPALESDIATLQSLGLLSATPFPANTARALRRSEEITSDCSIALPSEPTSGPSTDRVQTSQEAVHTAEYEALQAEHRASLARYDRLHGEFQALQDQLLTKPIPTANSNSIADRSMNMLGRLYAQIESNASNDNEEGSNREDRRTKEWIRTEAKYLAQIQYLSDMLQSRNVSSATSSATTGVVPTMVAVLQPSQDSSKHSSNDNHSNRNRKKDANTKNRHRRSHNHHSHRSDSRDSGSDSDGQDDVEDNKSQSSSSARGRGRGEKELLLGYEGIVSSGRVLPTSAKQSNTTRSNSNDNNSYSGKQKKQHHKHPHVPMKPALLAKPPTHHHAIDTSAVVDYIHHNNNNNSRDPIEDILRFAYNLPTQTNHSNHHHVTATATNNNNSTIAPYITYVRPSSPSYSSSLSRPHSAFTHTNIETNNINTSNTSNNHNSPAVSPNHEYIHIPMPPPLSRQRPQSAGSSISNSRRSIHSHSSLHTAPSTATSSSNNHSSHQTVRTVGYNFDVRGMLSDMARRQNSTFGATS